MSNVGSVDRLLRIVVGIALIVVTYLPATAANLAPLGVWKYALPLAGAVLMLTALFKMCPAYMLLGITTCPAKRS